MNSKTTNIDVGISGMLLTKNIIKALIKQTKLINLRYKMNIDTLTFTAQYLIGPYITIELKNYDEEGKEI